MSDEPSEQTSQKDKNKPARAGSVQARKWYNRGKQLIASWYELN